MSECMLCQSRRAGQPYLIEPVGLRIWSVEELIYFIGENLPLTDEEILNEKLVTWLKDELHMRRLAGILAQAAARPFSVREFVLPMYHETGYPGDSFMRGLLNAIDDLAALPTPVRLKKKADALVAHERYLRAIDTYQAVLAYQNSSHLGGQFTGMIHHNIGCVYARLFQMEEACSHLKESWQLLHSADALRRYLYAVWIRGGKEAFLKEAAEQQLAPGEQADIEATFTAVKTPEQPDHPAEALAGWVHDYHKSTGM